MGFKSRKLFVWFISLLVVSLIYLIYNSLSGTPQIVIDKSAGPIKGVDDFGREIGKIGDVGVGEVEKSRYTEYKNQILVGEFGFKRLLHKAGDEWEIEEPYRNIFRPRFKCNITADKGSVSVDSAGGRPNPGDATLYGNVEIRIFPEADSDMPPSTLYLDYIDFISERSLFRTSGPVKVVSKTFYLTGNGMEIVYDEEAERLEFLKIIDLDSLRLKTSSKRVLFSSEEKVAEGPGVAVASGAAKEMKPAAAKEIKPAAAKGREIEEYKCVLSGNVVIDTPEELVFADQIFINNVGFASESGEKPAENNTEGAAKTDVGVPAETAGGVVRPDVKPSDVNELPEEFFDVVVTCDEGILLAPMDSALEPNVAAGSGRPSGPESADGRITFAAQRIDYNAPGGETVARGLSELNFYADDMMSAEPNRESVPVKVTCGKRVEFVPALNHVVFEGDCVCRMVRSEPNFDEEYSLSAPKLTVSLSKEKGKEAEIEHAEAGGGVVQLAKAKRGGEKISGFIKLRCQKFDYATRERFFLATGPGLIAVDNSKVDELPDNRKADRFSLQKACWAFLRDFKTLHYSFGTNRIIAEAMEGGTLLMDYIPVVEGKEGPVTNATAGHIESVLSESSDGRNNLVSVSGSGGVTYDEAGDGSPAKRGQKPVHFAGSEFFYDANESVITAWSDGFQPCLLNGVLVDGLRYDLKAGKAAGVKGKIVGPGMISR